MMFRACENELAALDMGINIKKSGCLRIGPRFETQCVNITSIAGHALPWLTCIRYLGIYILSSRTYKCSLDQAKRSYYRCLNAIFGKVGRLASEEVILQLVSSKCLPILLYGTESCGLRKRDVNSLDFCVNRFLMKLFKSNNLSVIQDCLRYFNFQLPSTLIVSKTAKFISRYNDCNNYLCKLYAQSTG